MSVILNFNLSYTANNITSIVCLFDPSPAFQYGLKNDGTYGILYGNQLARNSGVASAGFNSSEISQVDINGNTVYVPTTVPLNLPSNSYVINSPSQVYGGGTSGDVYSVLQINSTLARIEPGFSRLQVTYQYYNSVTSVYQTITEYFDCPFYEGWDVTAQELNNIVQYVEQSVAFLQKEIDILTQEVKYALSHEFWRGTSVSGQLSVVPATEGLQTGALSRGEFSHDIESKSIGLAASPTFSELKSGAFQGGSSGITLTQTNPVSEYGRDTNSNGGIPSNYQYGFYMSEAVDGSGNRCIVLVDSVPWAQSSLGSITFRHDFTANGGAVDRTIGQTTNKVYTHVTGFSASSNSNATIPMTPGITTTYPTQTGASPNQNTLGAYTRVYEQYPYGANPPQRFTGFIASSIPLWCKGFQGNGGSGNNDGPDGNDNGAFSPPTSGPTNDSATGVVEAGWTPMGGAHWDTINIGGENYPRLVFYPDDSTTSIVIQPMFIDALTNEAYNNGGGMHGTNDAAEQLTLTQSTMNGTSMNGGNAILPYTMGLTPVIPPNGPTINAGSTANSGCIGQGITVTGNYFNTTYDSAYVAGQPASIQVLNQTTCIVTIPSVATGPTTLQITDGHHTPATISFTVNGQPNVTGISPTQAPPGSQITINGTNFGSQDGNSTVFFGNQQASINSWSNNVVVVTVPTTNLSLGPTQVKLSTDCGESTNSQFSVSNPDKVVISPHVQTVSENTNFQFSAIFYAGTQANDVTTSPGTTWSVNGQVGGENTHGTISQSGLYTAPAQQPPDVITVTVQYFDANVGVFISDSAIVTLAPQPVLTLVPANATLSSGQTQQFQVLLNVNGVQTDVTNSSTYFVNDTAGGDLSDGTINSSGLYSSPNNLTGAANETVQANYVYEGNTLSGTAVVTVGQAPTDHASITVLSQINVYLGDGRYGYVPTGTQIIAYPNQYVYVQFGEKLDNKFHLPIATYLPVQQLSMNAKDALDNDIANVIYNLADATIQPDGTTLTMRTVVLGIIDPSDGRWHSMWDIGDPIPGASGPTGHSFNPSTLFGSEVKAFKGPHTFQGSLVDYINDMSGGAQSQLDILAKRNNILLAGNCSYEIGTNKFKILDSLHILGISGENSYGIIGVIPKQEVTVEPNQYIYINSDNQLKVGNFSDIFLEATDAKTIFVGAVLDKFYTHWPLLKLIDVDTSNVGDFGNNSYMRVGPLLVQWGLTPSYNVSKKSAISNKIEFPMAFDKSCVVLTEAQNSSGGFPNTQAELITKKDFESKLINTGSTNISSNISWIAIGM